MPGRLRSVRLTRRLDRVEREADGAVADRVEETMHAACVDRDHRLLEHLRRDLRRPALVAAILVRGEHVGGFLGNHSIDVEFGRMGRNPQRIGALGCPQQRSEEHTSELQSLMRTSYAVYCLKKKQK